MQAELALDDKWTNLEERADDGTLKISTKDVPAQNLLNIVDETLIFQDLSLSSENQELFSTKELPVTCVEDISRPERNSGALTELATGSLATCTSILEVGKDESSKLRGPTSVSSSKLRLCFTNEKHLKMSTDTRKCFRLPNGSDDLAEHACKDRHKPSSISKFAAQESKCLTLKSSSCDSSKSPLQKLPATREETSDFCKVYSQEVRLGVCKDGSKSPKSSAPRKSVIELKSKSLDPPPSSDADILQDEAFRAFPVLRSTPSSLHPSSIKRRESETAVFSTAENAWLRRISDSHQARKTTKCDSLFEDSSNIPTPPTLKNLNIQKLRAFFGETTPRIMEAKSINFTRHQSTCVARDDLNLDSLKSDRADARGHVPCRCASTSGAFEHAGWAFEKMTKSKKSIKPLTRAHQELPSRLTKKSLKERDPSFSPKHYQKEHKTWKGKMVQTLRRYGSGAAPSDSTSSEEYTGALGVPLEHCVSSFANEFVPLIVETCTRIVEEKGLESVGVYRVPGNSVAANALIEELNKDPEGLCLENEKWQDVNLVSSLLKLFFRKLPDSLITDELYDAIIVANRIENPERRMLKIKKLIHELPEHNFETLRFLAQHLNRVASREEMNKMDPHNLAIVFGPTLVRPQEDSMVVMVRDMTDQCKVIESIIIHCDWYFSSWDEDVYVPVDGEEEDPIPISGMNSELLAKAERLDKRSSLSF